MECSVCHSTEHFWRACPSKGKGKGGKPNAHGKSSSSFPSIPDATTSFHANPVPATKPQEQALSKAPPHTHASMFMANSGSESISPARLPHTRITFMDGSPAVEIQQTPISPSAVANFWSSDDTSAVTDFTTSHAIVPARKPRNDLFYAWWHSSDAELEDEEELQVSYHSKVRLQFGESLLICLLYTSPSPRD